MPRTDDHARKLHPWLRVEERRSSCERRTVRWFCPNGLCGVGGNARTHCVNRNLRSLRRKRWPSRAGQRTLSRPRPRLEKRVKLADAEPATDSYVNVFIEFFPEQQDAGGGQDIEALEKADSKRAGRVARLSGHHAGAAELSVRHRPGLDAERVETRPGGRVRSSVRPAQARSPGS